MIHRPNRRPGNTAPVTREVNYRNLRNPFPPMRAFSDDHIVGMHKAALGILESNGIKVLLPEARAIFAKAGARVDTDTEMVFIGSDII